MGSLAYNFAGETAFVTGATGGMGKAIAAAFAAAGANVVLADIAAENGDALARSLTTAGPGKAMFVQTDVSDEASIIAAVKACVGEFGALDHAVNAAAIENESGPLHECTTAQFERMMAINNTGVFFSMKAQLEVMLSSIAAGRSVAQTIVNVASTNAFRPQPNQPAYTASKHAVLGLTRSAAIDYAMRGVRINVICPGSIDTPMLRTAMERRGRKDAADVAKRLSIVERFGTPEEIAEAALWLSSDASSFTYGHALGVDAAYLTR
jgi:NAD(P)-dependent dehydrogenase (short-subunit alcohol dehydrogenase family)